LQGFSLPFLPKTAFKNPSRYHKVHLASFLAHSGERSARYLSRRSQYQVKRLLSDGLAPIHIVLLPRALRLSHAIRVLKTKGMRNRGPYRRRGRDVLKSQTFPFPSQLRRAVRSAFIRTDETEASSKPSAGFVQVVRFESSLGHKASAFLGLHS